MIERVLATVQRYAMFQVGQRVGVAVSGGADSVCLLHVLLQIAPRWDLRLSVLHLNHQLRGEESKRDAAFVAELARGLGLTCHVEGADLKAEAANLEEAGRQARNSFYRSFLAGGLADRIGVGHTRSDQAETVLFRFLRGSGTRGLAGIRPCTPDGIVRPLIDVERASVREYLCAHSIPWREDSSNRSLDYARNRIRHVLLPALARDWNPAIEEALADSADLAQGEETFWEAELERLAAMHLRQSPDAVLFRASRVSRLPRAFARRLVRFGIERAKGDLRAIGFSHVEAILSLAQSSEGHNRLQLPGLDVLRSYDWVRLSPSARSYSPPRTTHCPLRPPCEVPGPGGLSRLCLELVETDSGYTRRMSDLDWDRISAPLTLRNWAPGDRYQAAGSLHPEKLKTLFQQARIPIWERGQWPVITSEDSIVWTRRFGPSCDYASTEGSRIVLRVRELDYVES